MTEYIKMTDAITTTWMILRGMGYAAEDNPDMVKTVAAVFDTAPAADVVERDGWVRASERIPELGPWAKFPDEDEDGGLTSYRQTKPVLVIDETGEMSLAEYHQEKWDDDERMRFDEWVSLPDMGTLKGVIWWAPTPEPPEEGT
jgi:hypothetical protein